MVNSVPKISFAELSDVCTEAGSYTSASEIHGLVSGLYCGGVNATEKMVQQLVAKHLELEGEWSLMAQTVLSDLAQWIGEALKDEDLDFQLLLPDDDEELLHHVDAVARWSEGFLVGFGTAAGRLDETSFSIELQGALSDIVEISRLQELEEESEEEERALFEVSEYVRMAALMIYTELAMKPEKPKPEHLH